MRSDRHLDSWPGDTDRQLQLIIIFLDAEFVWALSDVLTSECCGYQKSKRKRSSYFHSESCHSIDWTELVEVCGKYYSIKIDIITIWSLILIKERHNVHLVRYTSRITSMARSGRWINPTQPDPTQPDPTQPNPKNKGLKKTIIFAFYRFQISPSWAEI